MEDKNTKDDKQLIESKKKGGFALPMMSTGTTKLVVTSAAGVGVAVVALPFVGSVMLCSLAVGALAFILVMAYSLYTLRTKTPFKFDLPFFNNALDAEQSSTNGGDKPQPPDQFKLWDSTGYVLLFKTEPTVQDLIKARNSTNDTYAVVKINNGEFIKILVDDGKEALRVAVMSGAANGETGWVCRSSVVKDQKVA